MSKVIRLQDKAAAVIANHLHQTKINFRQFRLAVRYKQVKVGAKEVQLIFQKYNSGTLFDLALNTVIDSYCEGIENFNFDKWVQSLDIPCHLKEEIVLRREQKDCVDFEKFLDEFEEDFGGLYIFYSVKLYKKLCKETMLQ
jgi:hypothetical protein